MVELLTEYADAVVTENTSSIATDNINLLVVNISDKGDRDFTYKPTLSDNKTEEVSAILGYIFTHVKVYWLYVRSGNSRHNWRSILQNQKDISYNVPLSMIKLVYSKISFYFNVSKALLSFRSPLHFFFLPHAKYLTKDNFGSLKHF